MFINNKCIISGSRAIAPRKIAPNPKSNCLDARIFDPLYHLPKIHRSVLRKITIDLLYF